MESSVVIQGHGGVSYRAIKCLLYVHDVGCALSWFLDFKDPKMQVFKGQWPPGVTASFTSLRHLWGYDCNLEPKRLRGHVLAIKLAFIIL